MEKRPNDTIEMLRAEFANARKTAIVGHLHPDGDCISSCLALYHYLKDKKCKAFSEIEVKLNNDILVPDISIICDFSKFTEQKYEGAPDIVVEILSPSTMFNDFNIKSGKYMNAGVKEYWLIDPKSKTVIVNDYVNKTMISYEKSDSLKSNIFSDLEIDLNDIFM